jgi:uncharacterized membrane protein YphA (DoxX/SURF4 family)
MDPWNLALRIAFRFCFSYFILYYIEWVIGMLPWSESLGKAYGKIWEAVIPWVAAKILHLSKPVVVLQNGSGDKTSDFVQLFCFLVLAAIATLVWSAIDWRRKDYRRLHEWLRVYVRYVLAFIFFTYGIAKVIKLQFPFPFLSRLIEPYGDSSPMGLLWTFMGYSKPYTFFGGASEILGGVLLLFKRTTTLGALVSATVIFNIVMMNFSYDVPVKLFSLNLLALAVFLTAPDLRRLLHFFVLNRPTAAVSLSPLFTMRWMKLAGLSLKILFVGWIAFSLTKNALKSERQFGEKAPKPPIYGIYEVEEFTRNGEVLSPSTTDSIRWRKAVFQSNSLLMVRRMDDSMQRYLMEYDPRTPSLTLAPVIRANDKSTFVWSRPDPGHLVLEGATPHDTLVIKMRRIDESKFLLVNRGFHWINEFPFNR